jgi:hypothetical protein
VKRDAPEKAEDGKTARESEKASLRAKVRDDINPNVPASAADNSQSGVRANGWVGAICW